MGKYIISVGHTASGNMGSGASDSVNNLDESNCTREIAPLVCKYLEKEGHETHLLRIDKSNSYNCEDCYTRANQANAIGSDLFIEIHLNSGKEHTGDGAEVCISGQSSVANEYGQRVANRLSSALNIDNRGLKEERLIILRRTNMPSILVEAMFVDCTNPEKYNPDLIAKAIAEGILDKDINTKPVYGWNKSKDGSKWWYCVDVENQYYYKSEWKLIDGYWYLFDENGFCYTGWVNYMTQKDNKEIWYYLDKDSCKMAIGWSQINGDWYFFNQSGEMQTEWFEDRNFDFCTYSSGRLITNCDMYNYHFDENGHATKL